MLMYVHIIYIYIYIYITIITGFNIVVTIRRKIVEVQNQHKSTVVWLLQPSIGIIGKLSVNNGHKEANLSDAENRRCQVHPHAFRSLWGMVYYPPVKLT